MNIRDELNMLFNDLADRTVGWPDGIELDLTGIITLIAYQTTQLIDCRDDISELEFGYNLGGLVRMAMIVGIAVGRGEDTFDDIIGYSQSVRDHGRDMMGLISDSDKMGLKEDSDE